VKTTDIARVQRADPAADSRSTADQTSLSFSLEVGASLEHAFETFTAGLDSWWPRTHHIGKAEMAVAVLEPRAGGRWYELGVDGSTCEWGVVLAWEPPAHVAMSWHLDGDFKFEADRAHSSRVDVFFEALGPRLTRVTLIHSGLDRHGETWTRLRESISSGWPTILRLFASVNDL
jgi:hypothetical protein